MATSGGRTWKEFRSLSEEREAMRAMCKVQSADIPEWVLLQAHPRRALLEAGESKLFPQADVLTSFCISITLNRSRPLFGLKTTSLLLQDIFK